MRRGYSTASAVDIIADNLHVFVEQHKCRNIILLGRLRYCSRQRTFRIDTDEEPVIVCHAEIGAFDRRLNRCDRSARIGIIERRSLVFITSQQKSAVWQHIDCGIFCGNDYFSSFQIGNTVQTVGRNFVQIFFRHERIRCYAGLAAVRGKIICGSICLSLLLQLC